MKKMSEKQILEKSEDIQAESKSLKNNSNRNSQRLPKNTQTRHAQT
jgi:hypothetical protein